MQKVYKGRTQSGYYGYFTNGYLVMDISEDDYFMPFKWHQDRCFRWRFEYVVK